MPVHGNPTHADFIAARSDWYVCDDGFIHKLDKPTDLMTVECLECRAKFGPVHYHDEAAVVAHIVFEGEHRQKCRVGAN